MLDRDLRKRKLTYVNKFIYSLIVFLSCELWFPVLVHAEEALTLGLFPRRNAKVTIRMFKPLAEYLSVKTGRKINITTAKNFPTFWKNVMQSKYDIVHYNQMHYIESNAKLGYQVIVQNEEFGAKEIRGALVVRKDSGIYSVEDLKGKTILFGGGQKAFVAYVVNAVLLHRAGLSRSDYITKFAKNPPNATIATYLKQADAGGIGDIGMEVPFLKQKGVDISELKIIGLSEPFPQLPWAVNKSMNESLKLLIQTVMLSLNGTAEGKSILQKAGMSRFNKANDAIYDSSRAIIDEYKSINIK